VTPELALSIQQEELEGLREALGAEAYAAGRYAEAGELFVQVALSAELPEFLTIPAQARLS
jgi:malate synthase